LDFGSVGPPFWSDRPVILLGGGPSLRGLDFSILPSIGYVVGVNHAMFDCNVNAGISIDHPFVRQSRTSLCAFAARSELYLAVGNRWADSRLEPVDGAVYLRDAEAAISQDHGSVGAGGTSGYASLNLAVLKGAKRILLLGYDYGTASGRHHYHDAYRWSDRSDQASWSRWATNFDAAAHVISSLGIEVMNASPVSRIACFQKCTVEDGLRWARCSSSEVDVPSPIRI
jgi:hypothetical protein